MQKIIVTETIPFESKRSYTVFADNTVEAILLIKQDRRYSGGDLSTTISISDVKGTKQKGILKVSNITYFI